MFRILFYISHRSSCLPHSANSKWEAIGIIFECTILLPYCQCLSFTMEAKHANVWDMYLLSQVLRNTKCRC